MKYMANDGKVFDSLAACTEYEHNLNKSYWEIDCNYTENSADGIVFTFKIVMAIPDSTHDAKLFIQDWCSKSFGSPLLFVDINGDPICKYSIRKVSKFVYEKGKVVPFDKNGPFWNQTKLFCDAHVDIDYGLQVDFTGFYNVIEIKYKDIKDINIHEKNRINSLLGQYKRTKCEEEKTSSDCMNKTTSAGHHCDGKKHCGGKQHCDEKSHCQRKPDRNSELDKEIESIWDNISSVLDANPNYESLSLAINRMFHKQIQAGVYNEKDIIREVLKRYDARTYENIGEGLLAAFY